MGRETKTIVLIHGQWLTPRSWEFFRQHYEYEGYRVFTPPWPRLPGEVEEIRRDSAALAEVGLAEIVAHYETIVRSLDEPPILVGQGMGGLVVQILLDRGLGAVGVAIDSVPPQGVFRLPLSTLRALGGVLIKPWTYARTIGFTFDQFRYAFAHTMNQDEARWAYERYAIPGPLRTIFQLAIANTNPWSATRVNYHNDRRAPLLLIAGGADHLVPAVLTRINFKKYAYSTSLTDYKEFHHRSHLIVAQAGWREVAEYALCWAQAQVRRAAARDWQCGGATARSSPTS
jgi:pimeloyl-ACP methyl ester carboxylesterase